MGLYEKVQDACADKNMSVLALEEKMGFVRGTFYKWNTNKPSFERVIAVAKELDKPIEYFAES